ncbi:MAG: tripartite tricarboxylate transporter TctB family protein [Sutterella sp.]|nr:tripartite tricarboxylate transporter TctB family protein [Sutterella sp.]
MKRSDFPVVSIIYAIGLAFLIATLQLPEAAQTYPLVLISALLFLNTLYLIRSFLSFRRAQRIENDIPVIFHGFLFKQFAGVFIWCVAYLVMMYFLGYYLSTVLFLVGSLLFMRVNILHIAMTTVVLGIMVWAVFSQFLHVPLPVGVLFG